jgi:hypothetical protein
MCTLPDFGIVGETPGSQTHNHRKPEAWAVAVASRSIQSQYTVAVYSRSIQSQYTVSGSSPADPDPAVAGQDDSSRGHQASRRQILIRRLPYRMTRCAGIQQLAGSC